MTIPLIYFHVGSSETLQHSIKVSEFYKNSIVLLGDAESQFYTEGTKADFFDISNFNAHLSEFRANFINLSSNSPNIELICIARWQLIYNFLAANNHSHALYIDSDVLLFGNAEDLYNELFSGAKITLSHGTSGHTCFLETNFLGRFVEYFKKIYSAKSGIEWDNLVYLYQSRQKFGLDGGVCDMTLLRNFCYGKNSQYFDEITRIRKFNNQLVTFDDNINSSDEVYLCDDQGRKNVNFDRNGHPIVNRIDMEKPINFLSLHFQGSAKLHCKHVYEKWQSYRP